MRARLALSFLVFLSGCYSDQEQQEAACQLAADKFLDEHVKSSDSIGNIIEEGNLTQLCMREHGYAYAETTICVEKFPSPPLTALDATMVALTQKETSAFCYVPTGWVDRKIYDLEVSLGNVT
jgi:hypothetical protein